MNYFRYTMVKGQTILETYEVTRLVRYGAKIKKVGSLQTAFVSNATPTVADFAHSSKADALSALKHRTEEKLKLAEASIKIIKKDLEVLKCLNA